MIDASHGHFQKALYITHQGTERLPLATLEAIAEQKGREEVTQNSK